MIEQDDEHDNQAHIIQGHFPYIPNVRDGNGHIIMPHEYDKKMKHNDIVLVNVKPMMYVSLKSNPH